MVVRKTAFDTSKDALTNAAVGINHEQHAIHLGDHYFYKAWLENAGGALSVQRFMFRTPDSTNRVHSKVAISTNAEYIIEIIENPTVTADGTPVVTFNNDRDSTNTPDLTAFAAPTVTGATGTVIWSAKTGNARSPSGIAPAFGYEIIAKRNAVYVFELTKVPATTHYADIDFWWHEHIPSN
jgi:hypothetical protein